MIIMHPYNKTNIKHFLFIHLCITPYIYNMQNNDIVNKQSMGSILHHQCEEHHSLKQPKTKLFIILSFLFIATFTLG